MTESAPFPAARLKSDPIYAEGFRDGMDCERAMELRVRAESARAGLAVYRRRSIGWNGPEGGCYFWFVGWDYISLGFHVCLSAPNIEIHLPFGFVRIGWHRDRAARRDIQRISKYFPEGAAHD